MAEKKRPRARPTDGVEVGGWRVTLLPLPKGRTSARAVCFAGEDVLGIAEARRTGVVRCLWTGGVPELVTEPPGFDAWGGCQDELVGPVNPSERPRAARRVRRDGRVAVTDLHPAHYATSYGFGCGDGQQVGYGQPPGQSGGSLPIERALLWTGTAASVVELAGPDPKLQTRALCVHGGVQVGEYGRNFGLRAVMWRGSSESAVVLHPTPPPGYPPDAQVSKATGVGDGQQVGVVAWKKKQMAPPDMRAALWTGSAESFVDLTPPKVRHADAQACVGGYQVGAVGLDANNSERRATLWRGSAATRVDLQALLPAPWNRSDAIDVRVTGGALHVLGTAAQMVQEGHLEVKRAEQIVVWSRALD